MSLIELIFDFFTLHVFANNYGKLDNIEDYYMMSNNGYDLYPLEWLSWICTVISTIFIVVLCCLFIYKIVRLIGGLIR